MPPALPRLAATSLRSLALHALAAALLVAPWAAPAVAQDPEIAVSAPFATPEFVPEALRPWVPWVVRDLDHLGCRTVSSVPACVWPTLTRFDLTDGGGQFEIQLTADAATSLTLPGDGRRWPTNVRIDGQPALMTTSGDLPAVEVPRGEHVVSGAFTWTRIPEALPVPSTFALVDVSVNGEPLETIRREPSGAVWLHAAPAAEDDAESIEIEVWRRVVDGVPMNLTTRIELRVAGNAREVDLGAPLPEGFVAWRLDAPFPARIDEAGHLRAQVRAGTWTLELAAASGVAIATLRAVDTGELWPDQEIWTFVADDGLRSVRLDGASAIDPGRTSLPAEWHGAPTFRLTPDTSLTVEEVRRGEAAPPPPALNVTRQLWLDRDGRGLIAHDQVSGTLYQGQRLAIASPAEPGQITLDGAGQVITSDGSGAGVEVRTTALNLGADLRYPDAHAEIPAVGWLSDAQSLQVALQLPPGWRLLAVEGADRTDGAWVNRWSLYDLFLLLLTGVVAARIFGLGWGVATVAVIGLSWHEGGSVRATWLVFLVTTALTRAVTSGRIARALRGGRALVAAALAILVIAFGWGEVRTGLFPQLEGGSPSWGVVEADKSIDDLLGNGAFMANAEAPMPAAPPPMEPGEMETATVQQAIAHDIADGIGRVQGTDLDSPDMNTRNMPQSSVRRGLSYGLTSSTSQVDPDAVVQTGPGLPRWNWRSYTLSWQGPVSADHAIRLWLVPPWVDMILSFLRAFGCGLLAWWFITRRDTPRPGRADGGGPASAALVAASVAALVTASATAGEIPDQTLLQQLRDALSAPPDCGEMCVEFVSLDARAEGDWLSFEAELHAQADGVWHLPGPDSVWYPSDVRIDGANIPGVVRSPDGFLLVRIPAGIHRVEARGRAGGTVGLRFAQPPRVLQWMLAGWELDGYQPDEAPPGAVQLRRVHTTDAAPGTPAGAEARATGVAPRYRVTRVLDLGIPMMVHTQVERLSDGQESSVVRVGLLAGESVTTAGFAIEDGAVAASFAPGQAVTQWSSMLADADSFVLTAPADTVANEVWQLRCAPIYRCTTAGLTPSAHMSQGTWVPTWNPWPGETVTIALGRPSPIEGASVTIDSASMAVVSGRRIRSTTLTLSLRVSQGGEQRLSLPVAAELQSFTINGALRPVELDEGVLRYTVEPGATTVVVAWQDGVTPGLSTAIPTVDVGQRVANVDVALTVPDNRWVVWTGRATWGPVVRFWEIALALLVLSFVAARVVPAPIGVGGWLLLSLGMAQVEIGAPLVVVLWFAALGTRSQWARRGAGLHNLLQIAVFGLTLMTVVALLDAVASGLALRPPSMHIDGGGSYDSYLVWTEYSAGPDLPAPRVVWLPIWAWRATMLAWSAWLAFSVVRWTRWGWRAFTAGGAWQSATPKATLAPLAPSTASSTAPITPINAAPDDGAAAESASGGDADGQEQPDASAHSEGR